MDGWETRRRRAAGHDWCVIKLSCSGLDYDEGSGVGGACMISYVELDTAYFTGNQAPRVSIEAMKVTRTTNENNGGDDQEEEEHDNEDYLYNWMPGASTRLARGGGKGIRGTGQSPTTIKRALEACQAVARKTIPQKNKGDWTTILPMTPLQPGYEESRYHTFEIGEEVKSQIEELGGVTHLRLNYYPDGGVARLKVYGQPCHPVERNYRKVVDTDSSNTQSNVPTIHPHSHSSSSNPPPSANPHPYPELSSSLHGGIGLACSNKHYGIPANLLKPHPGKDMGDGWETARHPHRPAIVSKDPVTGLQDTPLMDWSVIKLGFGGAKLEEGVSRIIVDTRHFKGNFPESVTVDGCCVDPEEVSDEAVFTSAGEEKNDDSKQHEQKRKSVEWFPLLKRTALTADAEHEFLRDYGHIANGRQDVTHVRISITPDGGLSRVRIYGSPAVEAIENVPRSHL